TAEADRAAAKWPHHPTHEREPVLGAFHPWLVHRDHEVDRLDVRYDETRARPPEEMGLAGRQSGGWPTDLTLGTEDHRREQVVVQVLAHAGHVCDDLDPMLAKVVCRADPGHHQELR